MDPKTEASFALGARVFSANDLSAKAAVPKLMRSNSAPRPTSSLQRALSDVLPAHLKDLIPVRLQLHSSPLRARGIACLTLVCCVVWCGMWWCS
jgi:hypothetical protein